VVAVAVNTAALSPELAAAKLRETSDATGLPTADPIREGAAGADRLAHALLDARVAAVP
jgi:uncharacterized NAD-dependent epimerase/dehydratase family protein